MKYTLSPVVLLTLVLSAVVVFALLMVAVTPVQYHVPACGETALTHHAVQVSNRKRIPHVVNLFEEQGWQNMTVTYGGGRVPREYVEADCVLER